MSQWPETRISLIRRLGDRDDQGAWAIFEKHYQQPVYRFARSRGLHPDEALDVIQEVMLAVHRAAEVWQNSERRGSFRAWLAEAARRVTLEVTRQRSRIGRGVGGNDFDPAVEAISDITDREHEQNQDQEQRWSFYCAAALIEKQVNPQHWLAFWLTAIEGKSAEQVSAILNMKVGSVYSAKCRVLAKLKAAIESSTSNPAKGDSEHD